MATWSWTAALLLWLPLLLQVGCSACGTPAPNLYFPPAPCNESEAVAHCLADYEHCIDHVLHATAAPNETECEKATRRCFVERMRCLEHNHFRAAEVDCAAWRGAMNATLLHLAFGGDYMSSSLSTSCFFGLCNLLFSSRCSDWPSTGQESDGGECTSGGGNDDIVSAMAVQYENSTQRWCVNNTWALLPPEVSAICSGPASVVFPVPTDAPIHTPMPSLVPPTTAPITAAPTLQTLIPEVTHTPHPPPATPQPTTASPPTSTAAPPPPAAPMTHVPSATDGPTAAPMEDPCPISAPFTCVEDRCELTNFASGADAGAPPCPCDDAASPVHVWILQGTSVEADAAVELRLEAFAAYARCPSAPGLSHNFETNIAFQWTAAELTDDGPEIPHNIQGEGTGDRALAVAARSMAPDTTYRFRVVATAVGLQRVGEGNITVYAVAPQPRIRILGGSRAIGWTSALQLVLLIVDPFLTLNTVRWSCCRADLADAARGMCVGLCSQPFDDLVMFRTPTLDLSPPPGRPFPRGPHLFHARYKDTQAVVGVEIVETNDVLPELLLFAPEGRPAHTRPISVSATVKFPPGSTPVPIHRWQWFVNDTEERVTTEPSMTFEGGRFASNAHVLLSVRATLAAPDITTSASASFVTSAPTTVGYCTVTTVGSGGGGSSSTREAISGHTELQIAAVHAQGSATGGATRLEYRFGYLDDDERLRSEGEAAWAFGGAAKRFLMFGFTDASTHRAIAPVVSSLLLRGERTSRVEFVVDVRQLGDSEALAASTTCAFDVSTFLIATSRPVLVAQSLEVLQRAASQRFVHAALAHAQIVLAAAGEESPTTRRAMLEAVTTNISQLFVDDDGVAVSMTSTERSAVLSVVRSALRLSAGDAGGSPSWEQHTLRKDTLTVMMGLVASAIAPAVSPRDEVDVARAQSTVLATAAATIAAGGSSTAIMVATLQDLAVSLAGQLPVGGAAPLLGPGDALGLHATRRFAFDLARLQLGDTDRLGAEFRLLNPPPTAALDSTAMMRVALTAHELGAAATSGADFPAVQPGAEAVFGHLVSLTARVVDNGGAVRLAEQLFDRRQLDNTTMGVVAINVSAGIARVLSRREAMLSSRRFRGQAGDVGALPGGPREFGDEALLRITDRTSISFRCHVMMLHSGAGSGQWAPLDAGATTVLWGPSGVAEALVECSTSVMGVYAVVATAPPPTAAPEPTPAPPVWSTATVAPLPRLETSGANAVHSLTITLSTLGGVLVLVLIMGVVGVWLRPMEAVRGELARRREERERRLANVQPSLAQRGIHISSLSPINKTPGESSLTDTFLGKDAADRSGSSDAEVHHGPSETARPMRLVIDDELQLLVLPGSQRRQRSGLDPAEDPHPWL